MPALPPELTSPISMVPPSADEVAVPPLAWRLTVVVLSVVTRFELDGQGGGTRVDGVCQR